MLIKNIEFTKNWQEKEYLEIEMETTDTDEIIKEIIRVTGKEPLAFSYNVNGILHGYRNWDRR